MKRGEEKLRVVVAGQVPPPVGGQNLNVQRVLRLLRHEPDLIVDDLPFRFTACWSQVRKPGLAKLAELFAVVLRLTRLRLKGGPIDVVLYPVGGPHLSPILRDLCLLPWCYLLTRHVVLSFQAAGIAESLSRMHRSVQWLAPRIYGHAFGALVLSQYGRSDPQCLGVRRVDVIPNAVEDEYQALATQDRVKGNEIRILNVGHLCPDKGTPQLLEAFADVHRCHPSTRLYLVGECLPPYTQERLQADIERLGIGAAVSSLGLLEGDALQAQYAHAHLFVFASVAPYESFGMVLLEAMMWALPLVVTDWRGNLEVCGRNPGGVVCDTQPDLTSGLIVALGKALEKRERWRDWGELNRLQFKENFKIERLRGQLMDFLRTNFELQRISAE